MTRLTLYCLLGVVLPAVLPFLSEAHAQSVSPADDKVIQAKTYVDAGMAAQNGGDYDMAITLYRKAYALKPHPVVLFDIAQALRLAGRMDQAAELYQEFLAANPSGPQARIAREVLVEIRHKAEQVRRTEEARIAQHAREAKLAMSAQPSEDVRVPASPPTPETPRSDMGWTVKRKFAVAAAASGVLAVVAGTVLGVSAKSQQREAHALCPDSQLGCIDADRANDLISSAHDRAIVADLAFGAGAVVAIAAGVLWFTGGRQSERRVAIMPTVSPGLIVTSIVSF